MHSRRDNQGFSAVEVMIATVVLSLGLLPVFGMMTAGTRQSNFSEHALFAAPRAKRILESFLAHDYRYFAGLDSEVALDIGQVLAGSEPPMPEEYLSKIERDSYTEEAGWKKLDEGLGVLTVTIEWTFPTDGKVREGRPHRFVLKRLISQPDLSFTTELAWAGSPA